MTVFDVARALAINAIGWSILLTLHTVLA